MNSIEKTKFIAEMLFTKFQKIALTTEELSKVIPRSKVSLRRDRSVKRGIPYSQVGKGIGRDVAMYDIYDVAEFMHNNKVQVM